MSARCAGCGMELPDCPGSRTNRAGDCWPCCPACAAGAGQRGLSHRTLLRRLYAAGRSISSCQGCGVSESTLEIHFIRPLVRGGEAESRNLLVLCPECHRKAHRGARIKGRGVRVGRTEKRETDEGD